MLAAAAVLLAAAGLPAADDARPDGKPAPWVVITKDGHRIDALARPDRREGRALIRLSPRGQLTSVPEASIDWDASERYNAPRPAAPPAPPEEEVVEELPAVPLGTSAEGESAVLTIIGSKVTAAPAGESGTPEDTGNGEGEAGSDEGSPEGGKAPDGAPADGAVPPDPAKAAAELSEIRRQLASAQSAHEQTSQQIPRLESRLAELREKAALEPRSNADQAYESPTRRALEDVQRQLDAAREQVAALERRLSSLRERQVELGGAGE